MPRLRIHLLATLARAILFAVLVGMAGVASLSAQQVEDPDFRPEVSRPAFAEGEGPTVLIDEGHNNFHTADGRYRPFAELLRRDGYRVTGSGTAFSPDALKQAKVLVIANALSERNLERPALPTFSAFTGEEIAAIREWVESGGSLLLIADHMAWAGAAAELASTFGFLFSNGFAFKADGAGQISFRRDDGSLEEHPILRGRGSGESVDQVMSFTGQAFRVRRGVDAEPLMILPDDTILLMPVVPWRFSAQTPRLSASGMLQGAVLKYGSGRVAVFGEAAMFTAQISSRKQPMGMNHPDARQNVQFVLNLMHWLSGLN